MISLKEIRTRIKSVNSTRHITSAMKMVSAARLRKAQDAILKLRPYADKLQEILKNISSSLQQDEANIYGRQSRLQRVLLIMITSNRGLCGSFNSSVIRKTLMVMHEDYIWQLKRGDLDVICIGKSGYEYLKKRDYPVAGHKNELLEDLRFDKVIEFSRELMDQFVQKKYDRIDLIYNKFQNAAVQILTREQFLPIEIVEEEEEEVKDIHRIYVDYIYEPSREKIMTELVPRSLEIQVYKALMDSRAAEHGARMTAMHKASDNATELLGELRLQYNKARQADITNEILEIMSGANALDK